MEVGPLREPEGLEVAVEGDDALRGDEGDELAVEGTGTEIEGARTEEGTLPLAEVGEAPPKDEGELAVEEGELAVEEEGVGAVEGVLS